MKGLIELMDDKDLTAGSILEDKSEETNNEEIEVTSADKLHDEKLDNEVTQIIDEYTVNKSDNDNINNDDKTIVSNMLFDNVKSEVIASSEDQPVSDEKNLGNIKKKKRTSKKESKVNKSVFGGIILSTVILTVSILIAIGGISVAMEYWGVNKSDENISFNIPEGSTNDDIADILVDNGVIKNKFLFKVALRISKPEALYPGDITLQPSLGYTEIISKLSESRKSYETVTVTIAEGENLLSIAKKLEKKKVCSASDFLFEFNKSQGYDFENKIKSNEDTFYRMEGYFFPDTYNFYVGDSANNVTRIIREQFEKKITDKMYKRMDEINMDLNEVMTLASIVQLESENTKQMPKVASVFLNRLNDPETFPMLQSDTTKNYIKNVIKTQADNQTSIDHYTECYDTYQCSGLPAGPICNPGLDAINAVLYPEKTDYYYFCNNLKTGKTYYAKTLKQHEKNLVKAGLK